MMQESPKQTEEEATGRYYYDDATGYEVYDPEAAEEDDAEKESRSEDLESD